MAKRGPKVVNLNIEAEPTKELFVEMLTRDVELKAAIIDLADNSTDGARHLKGDKSWEGLYVEIQASPTQFVIRDNCGGMSPEVARTYAFRFGRPKDISAGKGDVGRFGVGMKRGLFKLGRHFCIHSITRNTEFQVTIDVEKWVKERAWHFQFDAEPVSNGSYSFDEQGTTITVKKLRPEVKDHFADEGFIEDLRQELSAKLENSIRRGLEVKVNGVVLPALLRKFLASRELSPAKKVLRLKGQTGPVKVTLWCGVGRADSKSTARYESGWYVYCNGRMLLEADKTAATGWGREDEETIPAYHPQYNDFRGLVFLEANDAGDLPWNTAKTALDVDHRIYRRVQQEMKVIARPVIDFFNRRKEENDALRAAGESAGKLQRLIDEAPLKPLMEVKSRTRFVAPKITLKKESLKNQQKIVFLCDKQKAIIVRDSLGVSKWADVGEEVFEYYFTAECSDE